MERAEREREKTDRQTDRLTDRQTEWGGRGERESPSSCLIKCLNSVSACKGLLAT